MTCTVIYFFWIYYIYILPVVQDYSTIIHDNMVLILQ